MPAPKRQVPDPPQHVYVRVTRFGGFEIAKSQQDVMAWTRVGVAVFRYRVEGRVQNGEQAAEAGSSTPNALRGGGG